MPLYEIFKVNSRLFMNCLDAMDNDQAGWRPSDQTNSAAFIALHLVDTRHWLAGMLGLKLSHPYQDLCRKAKSISDISGVEMPSLDDLRTAWKDVTGALREKLKTISEAELAAKTPWEAPGVDDKTVLGLLAFLAQHDSYHVGQMAILRKAVGLQAMSYS